MMISFGGNKRVNATYGAFEIKTDQGPDSDGDGSAPEPFDLFFASMGTCAGFYVLRFCQKRDLPTENVRVLQTWQRDEKRKITGITLEIQVPPEFPEKYHKALSRAANLCTVKRFIEDPAPITTTTVVKH